MGGNGKVLTHIELIIDGKRRSHGSLNRGPRGGIRSRSRILPRIGNAFGHVRGAIRRTPEGFRLKRRTELSGRGFRQFNTGKLDSARLHDRTGHGIRRNPRVPRTVVIGPFRRDFDSKIRTGKLLRQLVGNHEVLGRLTRNRRIARRTRRLARGTQPLITPRGLVRDGRIGNVVVDVRPQLGSNFEGTCHLRHASLVLHILDIHVHFLVESALGALLDQGGINRRKCLLGQRGIERRI